MESRDYFRANKRPRGLIENTSGIRERWIDYVTGRRLPVEP
jgi:hypothetical protein